MRDAYDDLQRRRDRVVAAERELEAERAALAKAQARHLDLSQSPEVPDEDEAAFWWRMGRSRCKYCKARATEHDGGQG
jgi:hypothetical protein